MTDREEPDDRELDIDDVAEDGARIEGKRDRLARLLSVLRVLQAHGDAGISPAEIARRTGMSKRSIYRDLKALETEMQVRCGARKGAGAYRRARSCRRSACHCRRRWPSSSRR